MWTMVHEKNAIEALAVTIRFAEPLSSVVSRRILRDLESVTSQNGLLDRQPVQNIELAINGEQAGVRQSAAGMVFLQNSLKRQPNGVVASVLVKQLTFGLDHILIQIFDYRSWEEELKAIEGLLSGALKAAAANVAFNSIRLEYLDRFIFDGARSEARARGLLRKAPMLTDQIFDAADMWHSHTGLFVDVTATDRLLRQVHADLQEMNPPHIHAGKRTVALLTASERQFPLPGREFDPEEVVASTSEILKILHEDAISLFKQVMDVSFCKEHGLPHDEEQ